MQSGLPLTFKNWFKEKGWQVRKHQLEMLATASAKKHALLVAPTGAGKTLAGFLPSLIELSETPHKGLHTLYISPLKALATDIKRNLSTPIEEMNLPIEVEMRTGDTPSSRRKRQLQKPPGILLTTPESLELMLSYPDSENFMRSIKRVIIDEIHALAPGKRGHLTALCLSRLKSFSPDLQLCGLSATVAEPDTLAHWLAEDAIVIRAKSVTQPRIQLLSTDKVPWSGYLASYAVADIYKAIQKAKTSIVFVNTRAQAEFLFQKLWETNKDNLPIALHHGSLEHQHRLKVEAMMSSGNVRAVVATASLDLGLDWGAVNLVIQVGAPKGISRLLQRIGRSNHRLNEPSKALLVPCNRFEMIECIAVTDAIKEGLVDGQPLEDGTLDVLIQYVMNAACAGGFYEDALLAEIRQAYPYREIDAATLRQAIECVATGGYSLKAYDRFQRMYQNEEGKWVASLVAARRHRMNTGTIVEYETLRVVMRSKKGRKLYDLGRIEEYFIQGLQHGDTFMFAGQLLRFNQVRETTVEVEPARGETPKIPSFKGGRLPLSPSLAERVVKMLENKDSWQQFPLLIQKWLELQAERSRLPDSSHVLIEMFPHEKMQHMMVYSFAGRNANQTLGLLITQYMEHHGLLPLGFVANDYAMALWSIKKVEDPESVLRAALDQEQSDYWIESSQMAKRAFREVAVIAGLVERQAPGKRKTGKQVTISTDLIYEVLKKYEPDHLLLKATRQDIYNKLTDIDHLRKSFVKLPVKHMDLKRISPLAVPLLLEIGIEKVKGKGEAVLLDSASREWEGDRLLREAS